MTLTEKIIFGAVVVVVAIIATLVFLKYTSSGKLFGFTSSGQYIENVDPYIEQNQGYNSLLPIQTANTLQAATTTLTQQVNLTNPTFCVNFYATSTATHNKLVASSSALVNGVKTGVILTAYGSCAN